MAHHQNNPEATAAAANYAELWCRHVSCPIVVVTASDALVVHFSSQLFRANYSHQHAVRCCWNVRNKIPIRTNSRAAAFDRR